MNTQTDYRKNKRYEHKATAMLEDQKLGYATYVLMKNTSGDGMCFESDYSFNLGTELSITLDKPIFKSSPIRCHGIVKWCRAVNDDDATFNYGIGVKIM